MHALIIGPGAMGCLVASILQRGNAGTDTITLLDYNQERAKKINNRGLTYNHQNGQDVLKIKVYSNPLDVEHADVIFLCVKSYDVEECLRFSASLFNPDSLLIFLQNGISHLKFQGEISNIAVAFGTTTEGATNQGIGDIRHAGSGHTYLGFLQDESSHHRNALQQATAWLCSGGMQTKISNAILHQIWAKLFINVGINALSVIYDCKNGDLLKLPEAMDQMRGAINEAIEIANCENIPIDNPMQKTISVCHATAENISSMLQDIRKGRKTEIDAINGALVVLAHKHGIPAPINSQLVAKVKEIENNYEQ